jgi:integrase
MIVPFAWDLDFDRARSAVWDLNFGNAGASPVYGPIGCATAGWVRRSAQAALLTQLGPVESEDWVQSRRVTFEVFAFEWLGAYPVARGLKRSTCRGYERVVRNHLVPAFGPLRLDEITLELVERYVVARRRSGLSGASVNRTLDVLSSIFRSALRRGLVGSNVVSLVERPREGRRRWRIFSPAEVTAVERALNELVVVAASDLDRDDRRLVRVLFLTLIGTGIRRGEALGLRWRSVLLTDPDGPVLRVEETWVNHRDDTPKSAAAQRTIPLGSRIAGELSQHRTQTAFASEDDRVFCNPRTGRPFHGDRYREIFNLTLGHAGIEDYVRPYHDLRHSSLTNSAAAGTQPEPLMARAGHSSYATTRRHIDLAGEQFREEANRLEVRLWGTLPLTDRNLEDFRRVPTETLDASHASCCT